MSAIPQHAKKVFQGQMFEVWQWEQKLFDGTTAIFEGIKRPDAATIIAVTPEQQIVMTEQLQPHWKESLLCLPGGVCDAGESALESAMRELKEETGYTSSSWKKMASFSFPGRIDWNIHTFIAKDCLETSELHLDAGEKITVRLITFDELIDLALQPNFRHRDIQLELVRAKYQPEALKALEKAIFG